METEQEQPKKPGRNGIVVPPAPKGNRYAEKHGLHTLKRSVLLLRKRAIDGRSAVAKALNRWRLELISDLGGQENISTQKRAIIDLAVKQKFLLESGQAVFARLTNSVNKRLVYMGQGTHLLFLEKNRMNLFREVQLFLDEPHSAG